MPDAITADVLAPGFGFAVTLVVAVLGAANAMDVDRLHIRTVKAAGRSGRSRGALSMGYIWGEE